MELPFEIPVEISEWLEGVPTWGIALIVLSVLAILYWHRSGAALTRLGVENRKLRRGIRSYEELEVSHRELSQETKERNRFQSELPTLIPRLAEEKTLPGISRQLIEFASRTLDASESSLFMVEDGRLVLRDAVGLPNQPIHVRFGEGILGAAAKLRRTLEARDLAKVDSQTRDSIQSAPVRLDVAIAAPLVARGRTIGVLACGGRITAAPAIRSEILSVIARLGATALENQLNFERVERLATTDGLTELSNVRNFREKLSEELARASRHGRAASVFLFDIDYFKNYNDQNGHAAGDECLRQTAEILRTNSRVTDLPARYGGEEFIILLPETNSVGARAFAEKIRRIIAESDYPQAAAQPLGAVTISGGVATFPDDGRDPETLIQLADEALYRCKEAGRNRVASASEQVEAILPNEPARPTSG